MQPNNKSTNNIFLLVHGAWHAAWCWERIARPLANAGHHVITPDLPGHGVNSCPANTVTFKDYVTHLDDLIQQQSEPVTLVGHSMAGMVISQVAEMIPERIRELVFIAGYIPQHQESLLSIADVSISREVSPFLVIDQKQKEIRLQSSPETNNVFFNRCSVEDTEYAANKLQTQPLQPFTHQVSLGENFKRVPKKSFVGRYDRAIYLDDQVRMSTQVTDNIICLDADHAAYYSGASDIISSLLR